MYVELCSQISECAGTLHSNNYNILRNHSNAIYGRQHSYLNRSRSSKWPKLAKNCSLAATKSSFYDGTILSFTAQL